MSVGDVPTWVAAVAAWAGVVVNALIVFVALAPIRSAKRERVARGRLVAASLAEPMRVVRGLLGQSAHDLATLMEPGTVRKNMDFEQILVNLKDATEKAPPLLACFDVGKAEWLDGEIGERLARTVGRVNVAFLGLSSLLDALAGSRGPKVFPEEVYAKRANVVKSYEYLPTVFHSAAEFMGDFTDYCDHLFPSWTRVPSKRAVSPWQVFRRLRGARLRRRELP